jgi:hypothetical protein
MAVRHPRLRVSSLHLKGSETFRLATGTSAVYQTTAMKLVLSVLLSAAISLNVVPQNKEGPATPEQLKLRDQLESMSSIVQLTCGLMMPVEPGEMYAAESKTRQADNNKYRLEFYKTANRGGSAKLSYRCGADEGGTIAFYMLSMNGKLTSVADYTRDRFGGNQFHKCECTDLRLGHFVKRPEGDITFEILNDDDLKGKVLWLSCRAADRLITF